MTMYSCVLCLFYCVLLHVNVVYTLQNVSGRAVSVHKAVLHFKVAVNGIMEI
jgi:hypothetical protein